jgi:hypothetical protein
MSHALKGAPPRMKKGRMAAGRSDVKDRLDIRAASRTNNVSLHATQAPPSVAPGIGKHVGENLTQGWHPVARLWRFSVPLEATYEYCV